MNNDDKGDKIRRVAAHAVVADEVVFEPGVVEIKSGRVVDCYKLEVEIHSTEWLGGTIEIKTNCEGVTEAYKEELLIQ